jgi:hypothetical protein
VACGAEELASLGLEPGEAEFERGLVAHLYLIAGRAVAVIEESPRLARLGAVREIETRPEIRVRLRP